MQYNTTETISPTSLVGKAYSLPSRSGVQIGAGKNIGFKEKNSFLGCFSVFKGFLGFNLQMPDTKLQPSPQTQ